MKTDQPMNEGLTHKDIIETATNWWCNLSDHETEQIIIKQRIRKPIKQDVILALYLSSKLKEKDEEIEKLKNEFEKTCKVNLNLANRENYYRDQIRQKEEEIKSLFEYRERYECNQFTVNNQKALISDLQSQLQASNAMAERLAEALSKVSSPEHIENDIYNRMIKDAHNLIQEYQNSKK